MSWLNKNEQEAIDTIASAIEDMVYSGILTLAKDGAGSSEKAVFSANFSSIVSNLIADRSLSSGVQPEAITTLMYHSILIFMNENLRIPKSLAIALGNDLEKYGNEMQCSALIFKYATILQKLFLDDKKEFIC